MLRLSHSTVSRALGDHPKISAATKKLVKQKAKELGYTPNISANQLSSGNSDLIGVIIPDISIPFFARVLESIQRELQKSNYNILLFNTFESKEVEMKAIGKCLKHRVDGVLVAASLETENFEHFEQFLVHDIPMVFFDRVANFLPVPKVIADDYQASYDANNYLVQIGCRKIAHISASINLNNSNKRLYGYLDALKDNNIEIDEGLIHYYGLDNSSIDHFISKIVRDYPEVDGVSVFNDYVANNVVNILQKMDKKIPEDISVIGFSDEPVATYMKPQLTTVTQVSDQMGTLSTKKLLSILSKKEPLINEKIVISPKLVLRESTKSSKVIKDI